MCSEFAAIASCTHGQLAKYHVIHANEFRLVTFTARSVDSETSNSLSFESTFVHSTKKIPGIAVAKRRGSLAHGGELLSYST